MQRELEKLRECVENEEGRSLLIEKLRVEGIFSALKLLEENFREKAILTADSN